MALPPSKRRGSSGRTSSSQGHRSDIDDASNDHARRRLSTIFDITVVDTSFGSAVESVILSPMNDMAAAVHGVLLATQDALITTNDRDALSDAAANGQGAFYTGNAGSKIVGGKTTATTAKLLAIREEREGGDDEDTDEKKMEDPMSEVPPVINIRPAQFGNDEVELIAKDLSPILDSTTHDSSVIVQTGQMTEPVTMNLRVLRAKNLPFESARVRIHVLDDLVDAADGGNLETDEDGRPVVDREVGITPQIPSPTSDPIWGGPTSSWPVRGTATSLLFFTIEDATLNDDMPGSYCICAKVYAADLLNGGAMHSPNCWLKLRDYGPTGIADCGRLEVRLNRSPEATLHKQENCPEISPGPAFPRMQSYVLRKMAMYSIAPVILNVYDVSNNPRIQTINNATKPMGYGGMFHAAIEIHGREYSFGGTLNKNSNATGIFTSHPKHCPMHHYRESVYLGDCELNDEQIQAILEVLRPKWKANSYNLFRKNCAFFCREFAIELGVGDIPEWVWALASAAEFFEPYAKQLHTYLRNRAHKPGGKGKAPQKTSINKSKCVAVKQVTAVLREKDSNHEAQKIASSTQESLLDHAMAARIQRSFRGQCSRNLGRPTCNVIPKIESVRSC